MKFHMLCAAALLVGSTAVWAQDDGEADPRQADATAASSAQSATEDEAEEEEDQRGQKVVCRTERITGSLTRRRRTCMTRNEWAALEARTRDDMIRAGSRASGSPRLCNDPTRPNC